MPLYASQRAPQAKIVQNILKKIMILGTKIYYFFYFGLPKPKNGSNFEAAWQF